MQNQIGGDLTLETGVRRFTRGVFVFGNLPWVVMGLGLMTGEVDQFRDYFFPSGLKPFVLAFHGSMVLAWISAAIFVYFMKGAEVLSRSGIFQARVGRTYMPVSPRVVKLTFPLMILGGVVGMWFMWTSGT